MHIVLYQPEIPQNTGNVARTCAATQTPLHLIEPLSFSLDDKHLKRAGLDYWHLLQVSRYPSFECFRTDNPEARLFYCSTKAAIDYTEVQYQPNDFLVFGPETRGLPEQILQEEYAHAVRIPMVEDARSLNLSNAVAIVLYEALRQTGFQGLNKVGTLQRNGV